MTYRTPPVPQLAKPFPVPSPFKGINAIASLMEMGPEYAIYAYNLIATQAGMQVRPGNREWCINLAGAGGVRTIIPVRGNTSASSKLFACTIDGIYDCTASTNAPTRVVTFPSQTGNAGWGSWDHCTNAGGDEILMYCDEVNGYYTYDTATSTWLKVTMGSGGSQISGVDPATFTFVRLHNNRAWFVQGGTGNAWFLNAGAVYGAATQFSFGNKFPHGGNLNSLWVFTFGSFFGTYLYLVGIGDAGDVIAYTGNDPTSSTSWSMAGQWYVGDIVQGRRCASNYGGDLNILCSYGAISLSLFFYQKDRDDPNNYVTKLIAPAIKSVFASNNVRGFEIVPWAAGNSLLILTPQNGSTYQFCYSLATDGWTVFQNWNAQTAATWNENLYLGTTDGRVLLATGGQDNVPYGQTSGVSIQWGCLGAFNNLQMPGGLKFVDLLRPYFLTDQPVAFNTFARFDFNIQDLVLGSGVGNLPVIPNANGWDAGLWDATLWGASAQSNPQVQVAGSTGSGRWCAAGILGASNGSTTLIGFEASVRVPKPGSFLG